MKIAIKQWFSNARVQTWIFAFLLINTILAYPAGFRTHNIGLTRTSHFFRENLWLQSWSLSYIFIHTGLYYIYPNPLANTLIEVQLTYMSDETPLHKANINNFKVNMFILSIKGGLFLLPANNISIIAVSPVLLYRHGKYSFDVYNYGLSTFPIKEIGLGLETAILIRLRLSSNKSVFASRSFIKLGYSVNKFFARKMNHFLNTEFLLSVALLIPVVDRSYICRLKF